MAALTKAETGQVNELLCLVLAHNICVLIHELFESNAIIDFEDCQPYIVRQGYCANS